MVSRQLSARSLWGVSFLAGIGFAAGPALAANDFPLLENLAYPDARNIILGYGWKPVVGRCVSGMASTYIGITGGKEVATKSFCKPYPEIKDCNVYMTYCHVHFSKGGECLEIEVSGNSQFTPSDPVAAMKVDEVSFKRGRCR